MGPNAPDTANTLNNLAHLYFQMGELDQATSYLNHAVEIYLSSRLLHGAGPIQRSSFDAETRVDHFVDGTVCLSLATGRSNDPFALAERGRAMGLREMLSEARVSAEVSLGHKDRGKMASSVSQIAAINQTIALLTSKGQPADKEHLELARAENEYRTLMEDLVATNEQFVATVDARGLTTDQAFKSIALDDQTAVITWHSFHTLTWGCVIRKGALHWVDLSKLVKESEHDNSVKYAHGGGEDPGSALGGTAPHLYALYRTRLQPLEKYLEGATKLI
ncbi:MAG: tetratricopeptide repeat protein, partial [Caldilineaceae bacterium]|nr:tetratricopeptide repeat protein [Caldilineaceae bacterium]